MDAEEESAPYVNLPEAWLVSDFMDACPPKGYVPPLPSEIVREMPALRKFVEAHPALLKKNVRRVLQQLIVDMAVDNVQTDKFVEFGVFVLDRCAIEGVAQFFDRFNEESFMNFIHNELFKYLITGNDHATHLLRNGFRKVWCSNDNCPNEGNFCCSRCIRKLDVKVFYCSKKCQKQHYPDHRPFCGKRHARDNMCLHQIWEDYMERLEKKYWRSGEKKEEKGPKSKTPPEKAPGVGGSKSGSRTAGSKSGSRTAGSKPGSRTAEKSVSRSSQVGKGGGGGGGNKRQDPSSPGKKAFKRGFLG
ncbi:hypothetical protein BSKO_05704 [Bryopsis sp. KO-2023]|nr:hypothetical protein BSKO_05704 [Bryopsis sp. KO-2023]